MKVVLIRHQGEHARLMVMPRKGREALSSLNGRSLAASPILLLASALTVPLLQVRATAGGADTASER